MSLLISHIRSLVNVRSEAAPLRGRALSGLPCLDHAYVVVEGGEIASFGTMNDLPWKPSAFRDHTDATGRLVLPCWCDSHTHIVYAGSREDEFVDKIRGLSYAEIAAKGGGILNSAQKLKETSEDELFRQAWQRLEEVMRLGTGAIEIKSGYGLSLEGELKMLRVIRKIKEKSAIPVKATFLGAHALPAPYKENREGYLQLILEELLPVIGREKLADYIDVFCEQGFFTPEETIRICTAGAGYGLKGKIHANQLHPSGGVQAGVSTGALSVDHLESMDGEAVRSLASSPVIGTLLPSAAFFLRMPYAPARELLDAGCALALASDYNPGSSPSGNMNGVISLSCIGMKLLPEEAINAATFNGACALELQDRLGSIAIGKTASLILTKPVPSLAYLPYAFGSNLIDRVLINGSWIS